MNLEIIFDVLEFVRPFCEIVCLQQQAELAQQQAELAQRQAELALLAQQPQYPPGVGELPLPYFSSESAGISSTTGAIDPTIALETKDRSEKKLKERDTKLKNPHITVDTNASIDDQVGTALLS